MQLCVVRLVASVWSLCLVGAGRVVAYFYCIRGSGFEGDSENKASKTQGRTRLCCARSVKQASFDQVRIFVLLFSFVEFYILPPPCCSSKNFIGSLKCSVFFPSAFIVLNSFNKYLRILFNNKHWQL